MRLPSGKRASLHGSGPPVLFSSGLFGLMPRRLYTKLFQELSHNITLAVIEDYGPTSEADVQGLVSALGVEEVGLLTHSSIDTDVLKSPYVRSAVLCDPVVIPRWIPPFGVSTPGPEVVGDVLILKASNAYTAPGIPSFITPQVPGSRTRTFSNVGHADLLDDTWADLGPKVFPWMTGASIPRRSFLEWNGQKAFDDVRSIRAAYRTEVAKFAADHLLHGSLILSE